MKIWLDDVRLKPAEFDVHCETVEQALMLINGGHVTHISFDHDLGEDEPTGYNLARIIEEKAFFGKLKRFTWEVHSANPVGAAHIVAAMTNAVTFWDQHESRNK
jgi:hypothetical protein